MHSTVAPEYLTMKQLSAYSGFGVRTIRNFLKDPSHPLPHFRIGFKAIRVRRKDFDEWIAKFRIDDECLIGDYVSDIINKF